MSGAGDPGMKGGSEVKVNLIPCGNCGKESSLCCGNCRKESFCSVICQKARRKQHKIICFPAKEEIGEGFRYGIRVYGPGSFWVATRDIEEGEEIFTDYPLMAGPGQVEGTTGQVDTVPGQQVCLGCHKILKDFDIGADERKCGDCGWPLCGDACPGIERHLKECESLCWMRECKSEYEFENHVNKGCLPCEGVYGPIRIIRLLALKKDDPIKWKSFLNLYVPDCTQNKITRTYALDVNKFEAGVLFYQCACLVEFTKEVILRLCAAETFHHRRPYFPRKNIDELLVYDKETRMDISCMENCYLSQIPVSEKMKDPHGIALVAAKRIQIGERLSKAYSPVPEWDGTKRRREIRMKNAIGDNGFICKCSRCSDPTELGTNVSAIRCTKCKSGHMLPLNPLDNKSKWKCDTVECSRLVPASDVDKVVNKIQMEADAMERDAWSEFSRNHNEVSPDWTLIDRVTKFVEKYEKILNPHHYILLNAQEMTIDNYTFMNLQTIRPDKPLSPRLSQKIDGHRRIAGIFLHIGTKVFPPLSNRSLAAHFYVGMSHFFSAQQAVRNEETCDVVQDWLKQGISHQRKVMEFKIKMSLTLFLEDNEGYIYMMKCLGQAYENALVLCHVTPNYRGIPELMSEFDQNICTGVPEQETGTVEKN